MIRRTEIVVAAPHLLLQSSSFIGRDQEIADIIHRLNDPHCRILTLVGPGGIGKTRLAIEIAHRIHDHYADGVYVVPLQPLQSGTHIAPVIARSLGLIIYEKDDALQKLLHYLSDRHMLLILDNFEHLIAGAGLMTRLLESAPDLRLLVTSREPLRLHEEWQWPVQGLHFPETVPQQDEAVYSAMQLFAARAHQINPDFMLADHLEGVARICQLVEGTPLAIELAANWTKSLSCEAIAASIRHNIDFLTSREQNIPERHRSMRAVYNHSWRLLFEEERRIFERLSVFRGGFTLAAAEQVQAASLEVLASLVDKSFIRQDSTGRYDMHELMRQYGAEQLAKSGGTQAAADRHLAYYADFVEGCEQDIKGQAQLSALDKLEVDFENIRAAWLHALNHRAYRQIDRMIESLLWFGEMRSFSGDVHALFEGAAAAFKHDTTAAARAVWARLAIRIRQSADAAIIEQALHIAQTDQNEAEVAYCLMQQGVYDTEHQQPRAMSALSSALERYRRMGDDFGIAVCYLNINYYQGFFVDLATITPNLDLALQHARKIGNPYHMFKILYRRGWAYISDGQYIAGEADMNEALRIARAMDFQELAASCIGSLGCLAFFRGEFARAKDLADQNMQGVLRLSDVGEMGFVKTTQANIACIEGDYAAALRLGEEALTLVKPNRIRERSAARVLAIAEYGLQHYDKAHEYAQWALAEERSRGIRLWSLPVFALLRAHEQDFTGAAAILGLIFTHPASPLGWFEHWDVLTHLKAQLAVRLGADHFKVAWQRGVESELADLVDELLFTHAAPVNQPLIEPLTGRELEVLRLIAQGLSNQQIADALTVVEGTVRSHVYNLCQKLGVRSRTHAVAQARALGLLK